MNYYTADQHFFHHNILVFDNRDFVDINEMNNALIKSINDVVGKKDTLIHLGDFVFGKNKKWALKHAQEIRASINCENIILVFGNHDLLRNNEEFKKLFISTHDILDYEDAIFPGKKIVACHFPLESWRGSNFGRIHLHGHCHNKLKRIMTNRLDVGVMGFDYSPVSSEQIFQIIEERKKVLVNENK